MDEIYVDIYIQKLCTKWRSLMTEERKKYIYQRP